MLAGPASAFATRARDTRFVSWHQSVLHGLRWLRERARPSLAMRYAFLNANECKECMLLVDGKVAYSCTVRLEAREMRLDPLPNKLLLRDLVTAIAPPDERPPEPGEA